MTKRKNPYQLPLLYARVLGFGALCGVLSFTLGIQSAGEVQPVSPIEAHEEDVELLEPMEGDIDGDGHVSIDDAIAILEIAQGYREALREELEADPNGDYRLTVEDALRILRTLSLR